jgi:hypothetical protein
MKQFLITVMLLSSITLPGQVRNFREIPLAVLEKLDSMGVDDSPVLNKFESAYFTALFKESLNGIDLTAKKIGFLQAGAKRSKKEYFAKERERFHQGHTTCNATLYLFDSKQKSESGGYDGAILYWSKKYLSADELVKKLGSIK